jgi:hypothetical protein
VGWAAQQKEGIGRSPVVGRSHTLGQQGLGA